MYETLIFGAQLMKMKNPVGFDCSETREKRVDLTNFEPTNSLTIHSKLLPKKQKLFNYKFLIKQVPGAMGRMVVTRMAVLMFDRSAGG